MSEPLKLNIWTRAEGEPVGFDSTIITVPGRWYVSLNGQRTFLTQLAGRDLRQVSERQATNLGETLHHAEWTVTDDPERVRTLGLMHDCLTCRAGVDQALAYLAETPGSEVAVGQLWWAQP